MKTFVTVTLAHHGLELRCPGANLSEDRPIAADDAQCLQGWARRYLATAGKDDQREVRPGTLQIQVGGSSAIVPMTLAAIVAR